MQEHLLDECLSLLDFVIPKFPHGQMQMDMKHHDRWSELVLVRLLNVYI